MTKKLLIIHCWLLPLMVQAQFLLNGSFENATLDCGIDLSNQAFTASVPQVVAFGELGQPDILTPACGMGSALHGEHFAGLRAIAGVTDAIGIEISEPLISGKIYSLEFYERTGQAGNAPFRLSIGTANVPQSHGELLHTAFELHPDWTKHTFNFMAPLDGKYITVIVETGGDALIFVDHFKLDCPQVKLGRDTTLCRVEEIELQAPGFFSNYLWSDGSTDRRLNITAPGLYWVEAELGDCVSRDSIRIFENPNLCNCNVYLPTAFSPNGDGTNDTWQPLSPCDLSDYELLIFNRWGSLVFKTGQQENAWTGRLRGKDLPAGAYVFQLRYRLPNAGAALQRERGTVILVR